MRLRSVEDVPDLLKKLIRDYTVPVKALLVKMSDAVVALGRGVMNDTHVWLLIDVGLHLGMRSHEGKSTPQPEADDGLAQTISHCQQGKRCDPFYIIIWLPLLYHRNAMMDSHTQGVEIDRQADQHLKSIGNGTPPEIVENLSEFARDAALDDFYHLHSEVAFWYQALDKDGWESKVRTVADSWVKVSCRW